ncbi:spore germination protein [Clostridium sp. JN-9]|uniref:spore germination protein n=1 Tax=Clostridium sp. JN-9 TaxID=2507159 RepID=UPI000FFE2484|nr:spore germination protein [Clostridium sp. JN-9]QAT41620.1 spore germination protein [Clostridium sp. JN-9]
MGNAQNIVVKNIIIGNEAPLEAAILYVNALANKDIIDRDILTPLMLYVREDLHNKMDLSSYVCKKYIAMSNTVVEKDINKVMDAAKRGRTIVFLDNEEDYIIADTIDGIYRGVEEPQNESVIRGSKEGFTENIETNISMIRRRVKDENLKVDIFTVGRRSQTDLAVIYIGDIADKDIVNNIEKKIKNIDVDMIPAGNYIQQFIEEKAYTVFPQMYTTERPDVVEAKIMEGRIAIIIENTPIVITAPTVIEEFFQTMDDYAQRTTVATFYRVLRLTAIFITITLPSIYLTFLRFNPELIPIKLYVPIVQSRIGIALSPFLEILSMELIIEFLREGGLRLPSKIAQTMSVVGGIIIGDTAVKSKIVSPSTVLVIGITVVASFLIPNHDMLEIRILRFPMLVLANLMGILGIGIGWLIILVELCSTDSFGVPYLQFKKGDMKDIFVRAPLFEMNNRPEAIPNDNPVRQTDFREKSRRK